MSSTIHAQDFTEEFESLINTEKPTLLPEKMLISQRVLWGEKGLLRKTGIVKLSLENREKELVVREKMLKAHQIIGYITFAGMIYQGILGGKLYNGDYSVYEAHKTLGKVVTVSYFTGAGLSLFTPPPLVNRKREGLSNIRLHKILANVHVPAMIGAKTDFVGIKRFNNAHGCSRVPRWLRANKLLKRSVPEIDPEQRPGGQFRQYRCLS